MTRYYIELSDSVDDRLYLKPAQIDLMNYDHNRGYDVFAVVICPPDGHDGEAIEVLFPSRADRDEYEAVMNLDPVNGERIYDVEGWITCEEPNGRRTTIPCRYDVDVDFCVVAQ